MVWLGREASPPRHTRKECCGPGRAARDVRMCGRASTAASCGDAAPACVPAALTTVAKLVVSAQMAALAMRRRERSTPRTRTNVKRFIRDSTTESECGYGSSRLKFACALCLPWICFPSAAVGSACAIWTIDSRSLSDAQMV